MSPTVPPSYAEFCKHENALPLSMYTYFDNADVGFLASLIRRNPGNSLNPILNGSRDVWNDLDCLSEVVTPSL